MTFSAAGLPGGLSIDAATGLVGGTVSYTAVGAYSVSLAATDGVATDSRTVTWTITDANRPPTLTDPGPQSHAEGDTVSLQLAASDLDGDALTFSAAGLPGGLLIDAATGLVGGTVSYTAAGVSSVTLAATDGVATDSRTVTWTITDANRPPTLTDPGPQSHAEGDTVSLQLAASDLDGDALTFSAAGLPGGLSIDAATGLVGGTVSYTAAGTHSVALSATDGTATDSRTVTWTVTDTNRAPTLTDPGPQSHAEGDTVSLQLAASDLDGDALTFSAAGLPGGLLIDAATGLVGGTVSYTAVGAYSVSLAATDGVATDSRTVTWTITDANRPPTLTDPGPQSHAEGDTVSLQLAASDLDGDALTFSAAGLPGGLLIDAATGLVGGTVSYTAVGAYSVSLAATDGVATDSRTVTWTITDANRPPTLTDPGPQSHAEGDTVSLQLAASDLDGDALTFSAAGLPGGLSIDAATGLVGGTVSYTAAGTHSVALSATDGTATDSRTVTWTVTDTNRAPTLTDPGPQSHAEGDTVSLQLAASDLDGDALTFSAAGLPGGLSIDAATGLVGGTVSYTAVGAYSVSLAATDGVATDSRTVTWTITDANRPPTLTDPGPQSHAEGDTVSLQLAASDLDGDALTFSAAGLPSGLTVGAATGLVGGTVSYTAAGTHSVALSATDGTATDSRTVTWTVTDTNRPPAVTHPGNDRTDAESELIALQIVATDPDGDALTFAATNLPPGLTLDPTTGLISGTVAYTASAGSPYATTVTVTDSRGASVTASCVWTVTDTNQPPTLTDPGPQGHAEGDTVSVQLAATDPDGDAFSFSATPLPSGFSLDATTGVISGTLSYAAAAASPYTVTVTVDDGAQSTSQTFTWSVNDVNRGPAISSPAAQAHAEADLVSLQLAATDADGDPLTYSATNLPSGLSINPTTGLISGTLSYTAATVSPYSGTVTVDDGALSATQPFTWAVSDTNGSPTLAPLAAQAHAEADTVWVQLAATDPDGDALTFAATNLPLGLSLDATTGLISGTLSYTAAAASPYSVTVTVDDGLLSTSESFTWTVSDTNRAPSLTPPPVQAHTEADTVSVQLAATDADADAFSFSATPLPSGLSLDATTGVISGTLSYTAGAASPYSVTVTVDDGAGSTSQTFTWSVDNVNRGPAISSPAAQAHAEADPVSVQLAATDPDGDTLTYSATNLPSGLSVNPTTGLISGTLSYTAANVSPYTVTVTVDDGALSAIQLFTWTIDDTNGSPTLAPLAAQAHAEDDTVWVQLAATDPDGDALTFAASNLPLGLSLDATTGVLTGTLSYTAAAASPYHVTVTADDGVLSTSGSFTWSVGDTNAAGLISSVPAPIAVSVVTDAPSAPATEPGNGASPTKDALLPDAPPQTVDPIHNDTHSPTLSDGAREPSERRTRRRRSKQRTRKPARQLIDSAPRPAPGIGYVPGVSALRAPGSGDLGAAGVTDRGDHPRPEDNQTRPRGSRRIRSNQQQGTNRGLPASVALPHAGDRVDRAGDTVELQISTNHRNGEFLTFSARGLPPGLRLDQETGIISGTIRSTANVGIPYAVRILVVDYFGYSARASFNWTVTSGQTR